MFKDGYSVQIVTNLTEGSLECPMKYALELKGEKSSMRLFYSVILTVYKHSMGTPDKMVVTQVHLFQIRNVCPICRFVSWLHS